MAIGLEFASVILRKSALERHFPGGVDGFALLPPANLAEDEHLLRVGFMSTFEAEALVSKVEALASPQLSLEENVAVVQWGALPYPAWLSVGVVDGDGACWLAGTEPGAVVRPDQNRTLLWFGATEDQVLEGLRAASRVSLDEPDANGDAPVICARDEALVDVRVWAGDDRMVVLMDRRLSRRGHRAADVLLARDLAEELRKRGAREL